MKRRTVDWSADAIDDLISIACYIAEDNTAAARKVAQAIRRAGDMLGNAAIGRKGRVEGTYEKPVLRLPYLIVYKITAAARGGECLSIVRVIHTARDYHSEG